MPTPKLWWNGSAWVSSEAYWLNGSTYNSSSYCYITYKARFIAYADVNTTAKVEFTASMAAAPSGAWLSDSSSSVRRKFYAGGTTLFDLHNSKTSDTADVTAYMNGSTTFTGSGQQSVQIVVPGQGSHYGSAWNSSHSTSNIPNPFCTITYNANGGSDAPASHSVCKGASCELSSVTPTRANHTFLGWATSSSAHVKDYDAGGNITASADTTLYAVWEPCVFLSADEGVTITFDGVDYTNTTASVGKTWGNEYALNVAPNTGFIVKTQSHPNGDVEIDADEITISATSQRVGCHIDDGNDWVQAVMYLDTGAEWVMVQAYVDDGAEWRLVY